MKLHGGYLALAIKLQEAADALSARDVQTRLSDAINDAHRGTGQWAYYVDHFGDDASGDVVYSCNGDMMRAPYEISGEGGAAKCSIDMENAVDVVPRTIYEEEQDEADHYAQMEESFKTEKLYTSLPLYERFISKNERDNASADDFAGKGKSFPILKPEDVMAAVRSMGRAGSGNLGPSGIKARIMAIAKRKGWTKYLPKSWQGDGEAKESKPAGGEPGTLKLTESCAFAVDLTIREAMTPGTKIKLIAPGKGSSAYYTEAALKQAVTDNIFHAGVPMRIDHPTLAEEAARPEGSVKDWGAVLATDAVWMDDYKGVGPGLFSEVKPFSDHATTIAEKGPYAGVSIRANGDALLEAGKPVLREGVPVLRKFTSADGVDMVTRAGAGGMFLSESARRTGSIPPEEEDVNAQEFQRLQESHNAQVAINKRLLERAIKGDARDVAERILKPMSLHEAAKAEVVTNVLRDLPIKDGELDEAKFTEAVNAEAKRIGALAAAISGNGRPFGMGAPAPVVETDPVKAREAEALKAKALREAAVRAYMDLGMPKEAAERAAARGFEQEAA